MPVYPLPPARVMGRIAPGAGDFVVDDDGMGYADYGEDDWGVHAEAGAEPEPSPEEGKKRKRPSKDEKGMCIEQDGAHVLQVSDPCDSRSVIG